MFMDKVKPVSTSYSNTNIRIIQEKYDEFCVSFSVHENFVRRFFYLYFKRAHFMVIASRARIRPEINKTVFGP